MHVIKKNGGTDLLVDRILKIRTIENVVMTPNRAYCTL